MNKHIRLLLSIVICLLLCGCSNTITTKTISTSEVLSSSTNASNEDDEENDVYQFDTFGVCSSFSDYFGGANIETNSSKHYNIITAYKDDTYFYIFYKDENNVIKKISCNIGSYFTTFEQSAYSFTYTIVEEDISFVYILERTYKIVLSVRDFNHIMELD